MTHNIPIAGIAALAKGDFDNFIGANTLGGIIAQEKAGQQMLINSTLLPKEMRGDTRKILEDAGCTFGEEKEDIFIESTLPKGWKKVCAPDHYMWSYLVDENGKQRASIFYKAAFYDRKAHINIT